MENRLAEVVVRHGFIDRGQLDSLIAMSRASGEPLVCSLVSAARIDDRELARILARELNLPLIDFDRTTVPEDARTAIPATVAWRRRVVAMRRGSGVLDVAMADPTDLSTTDHLRVLTGLAIERAVAPLSAIEALLGGRPAPIQAGQAGRPLTVAQGADGPAVQVVDALLTQAVERHASDIHFEPGADGLRVRMRVDGRLQEVFRSPVALRESIVSRLKVMASLNIAERRLPQDGRFRVVGSEGEPVDLRVSSLPSYYGEKLVLRLLDRDRVPLSIASLRMPESTERMLRAALRRPNGMILVTGPTGSGKTTTLYAALAELNSEHRNVCTVEDPVELHLTGITQVQIHDDIGFSFAAALRALLRQDPDVLMVGEIRDPETAAIAVRAALTGHLVLSTLHTNDAASAIARLSDMGVSGNLLAAAVHLVVAQRLLRRRCTADAGDSHRACRACSGSGYAGRVPVFEMLPVDGEIRSLIRAEAPIAEIRARALASGAPDLRAAAAAACERGETDWLEAASHALGDDFDLPAAG